MTFKTSKKRLLLVQFRLRRSSRSQMFFKISVLKNFALFTGKHLCWSLFLIKRETGVFLWILRNFYEQLFHRTPLAAAFFVWSMGWCLKLTRFLTTKWQNSKDFTWPICSQCTLSLPPESIRKPYGFLMFSGSTERVDWE